MPEPVEKILHNLQQALEEIRALFILTNREILEKEKRRLLQKGSVKERIYHFCDGSKTISEMAKAIGKDDNYVRSYLVS